jgi:hypothetical protein
VRESTYETAKWKVKMLLKTLITIVFCAQHAFVSCEIASSFRNVFRRFSHPFTDVNKRDSRCESFITASLLPAPCKKEIHHLSSRKLKLIFFCCFSILMNEFHYTHKYVNDVMQFSIWIDIATHCVYEFLISNYIIICHFAYDKQFRTSH